VARHLIEPARSHVLATLAQLVTDGDREALDVYLIALSDLLVPGADVIAVLSEARRIGGEPGTVLEKREGRAAPLTRRSTSGARRSPDERRRVLGPLCATGPRPNTAGRRIGKRIPQSA